MPPQVVRPVRETIRREYAEIVREIDEAADAVAGRGGGAGRGAADRDAPSTAVGAADDSRRTDGRTLSAELRVELESRGVPAALSSLLSDAVAAAGCDLPADPVPAPPYIVVTSRGPLARAAIDPGRLVIRFDAFEVVRGRGEGGPAADPGPAATGDPTRGGEATANGGSTPVYRRRDGVEVVVSLRDRR